MRFQAVGTPVPRDACGANTEFGGHLAGTPMRGGSGGGLRGQLHQARNIDLGRRRATRQIALNTSQPQTDIPLAPARDLHTPHA